MNNIYIPSRKPMSWWDMVTPREEEMPGFIRAYMGKGKQFRTPKRVWEDLWRLKRGEMNQRIGKRSFSTKITNFTGPKYQRGMLHPIGMWVPTGTSPNLQDVTDSKASGTGAQRIHIAYDSDGSIRWAEGGTTASIVYADFTTQTDDSNDHTNDWWPDQPDTNEGLNWDIQYTNETSAFSFTFRTTDVTPVDRNLDEWYLLDDVSNDIADATLGGAMVCSATGKGSSSTSSVADVEIGTDPTAVANHTLDLDVTKTV